MTLSLVLLCAGFVVLTGGAELLVRGSASLAIRLGLSPLIAGLTVVAFGTSSPELVVSLLATLSGKGDIAIGNVIGSNIFNIGIILGLTAIICPVSANMQVVKQDGPIMLVVAVCLLPIIYAMQLGRVVGGILFSCLVAYIAFTIWQAQKDKILQHGDTADLEARVLKTAVIDVLFIGGGLVLLVAGSKMMVGAAIDIAKWAGLSEAVIGLTIIAAGTSLPELATSLVAAYRRQPDIAIGNIIGSNIFNILGILGICGLFQPLVLGQPMVVDAWVMVAFSVALLPLLYTGFKLHRWEGFILLTAYCCYLGWLWP